jgi:predicted GNAT family acetyltransferase
MSDPQFSDNPQAQRYELSLDGHVAARAEYRRQGDVITLVHTVVEPGHEGEGLGSKLAQHVLQDIRQRGLKVVAQCKFMAGYIGKHPEYSALLA